MLASTDLHRQVLDKIHENYRDSVPNLLHYIAVRRYKLRYLQGQLDTLGLASPGRAEAHVMSTVEATLQILDRLTGQPHQEHGTAFDFAHGASLLESHTNLLLGNSRQGRTGRIMVTVPAAAAEDYTLIHELMKHGMDCMRISCAHGNKETWQRIIENMRRAEHALGQTCKIAMSLGGPELRTGPIEPGVAVTRVRPYRNAYGRMTAPARIWLTSETVPHPAPSPADISLSMPDEWLQQIYAGARIRLTDARDVRRNWKVVDVTPAGSWAEAEAAAYLVPGTQLTFAATSGHCFVNAQINSLPSRESSIQLRIGDRLAVTRACRPGKPATYDSSGQLLTPASIGCSLPAALDNVRAGETIWFDDGKIGGIVENVEPDRIQVRISWARLHGEKLKAGKTINLPDTELDLPALTDRDFQDLDFVATQADIIELPLANNAADVNTLVDYLVNNSACSAGIVLKIETRRGFQNLPDMLLTATHWPSCGVMIAGGELAVECGFERMAEVQEEILGICKAAHVPVIWATQVLETLVKSGRLCRAEISDAAMGHRAECVLLDKGPHILTAVRVLDDLLQRTQTRQSDRQPMLRELRLADIRN